MSRPLRAALLLALALVWIGPGAGASEPVDPSVDQPVDQSVAVLPPRAPEMLASVDAGIQEWLVTRTAAAGLSPLQRGVVGRAVAQVRRDLERAGQAGDDVLLGTHARALAEASGAAMLLFSDLRYESGQVDLRLRLHDGAGGAVVAGSRVEGKLGELGSLLQQAMDSLTTVAGLSPGPPGAAVPRLADLGRYERVVRRIESGELAMGWRDLSGMESATAVSLRNEIRALGNLDSTPISERSRLASASGAQDKAWLHVRRAMVEGDDPEMMLAGADAAMARQDPELAQKLYGEALAIDPDHRDAHLGMARAASKAGRIEAAKPALERAIALDPSDPEPYEMLGGLENVEPEERAEHLLEAGRIRGRRLEIEPAEQNYQQAGDLEPSLVGRAQQNVAAFNERMGRYENALLSYEDAAAVGDPDPDVMAGLGRSRARMGDLEGAEEAYSAALAMDETHAASLHGMGSVMSQTGRSSEAIPLLERAVASKDKMNRARQDLAQAYHAAGDPDAALATLTTGDVPGPERADMLRQAAEIQREEGRLDDARITLEEAQSIEPFDPPIHEALVGVYEASGDADAAERERMRLASLQGREIAPTSRGDLPAGQSGPAVGTPKDFERLFASFPVKNPESRKEIRKVAYLGLRTKIDGEAQVRRWLSPFTADVEALNEAILNGIFTRYEAQPPPDPWPEVAQGATDRIVAFGTDREDVALINDELDVDAAFVVELERDADPTGTLVDERYVLRVRMVAGKDPSDVVIRANEMTLPAAPPFRIWNLLALAPLGLVLALLSYPVVRGWGSVVVELDWDQGPDTKGFFAIEISRRPGRVKPQREKAGKSKAFRYQKKTSPFKRGAASMVGRETTFRWIPAGQRYVTVHGLLLDELSREVIGNYLEERRIKIPRGRPERVSFDFTRRDASLEVRVVLPEGAESAELPQLPVALRGRPDTLRYMRDGTTLFRVGDGQHGVLVAESDRVHDVDVLVSDHRSALVTITLGSDATTAFTDCPDAVEPYVQGDIAGASAALDRAGQTEIANLLRARFHEERGEAEEAARYYQAAGHATEAAEVAAEVDAPELSASRFADAGEFGRAAEKYEEAGDVLKAAQALEASYDYEGAIDAYRKAGAEGKVIELLEKTGGYYEAGQLAAGSGDEERAIQLLQLVDLRDPDYAEACVMLARIFMGREEWDLAVHKAEEAIQSVGEGASLQLHEQLARALDRSGRTQEAITTWETIRKRDAQYPEAAEQLEYLRQRMADAGTRADPEAATHIGGDPDATDAHDSGPGVGPGGQASQERYEILGELGRGGMGIVFKAKDTRLGRVVALKRLPDNLRDHPTAVQLFLREARAAAALNHPNIVTLFDADQSADGNYYLTMEMLEGLPLDQILERRTRLGARDTLRLATQIATGLQFAHEKGVIHRDIKTSNLFFTQDKVVKIMDFGLAKMTEEVRRAATVIGGTPYYMAPEQSEGKGVDHRADLYAFGVTLFELLTGSVPFKEGDVAYHHRHTPPPDPRELVPDLPAPLAELILRLMSKAPDDRFATTAELSTRLAELARSV